MRSIPLAAIPLLLAMPGASATVIGSGSPLSPADVSQIVSLTNTYLQAAASPPAAPNDGWLDAGAAGNTPNRGQSLLVPPSVAPSGSATVTLNALNNNSPVLISANDGHTAISNEELFLSQFNVTYNAATPLTFNTFCVDLFHTVTAGQTYMVNANADLGTTFTNAAQITYILNTYGEMDLAANPDQAAAVQLAIWDLSLNNHASTPTGFVSDGDGTYSSGDPSVFAVSFAVPVPEPPSLVLLCAGLVGLAAARILRRRAPAA